MKYTKINSIKEGYEKRLFGGYIWQYNTCLLHYTWDRSGKKHPILINTNTNKKFTTLKEINQELKFHNLEIEPF